MCTNPLMTPHDLRKKKKKNTQQEDYGVSVNLMKDSNMLYSLCITCNNLFLQGYDSNLEPRSLITPSLVT